MSEKPVTFNGVTPYLHYDNISVALEWLTRVFGFVEKGRWLDEYGHITNAELTVGPSEIWLDGSPDWWKNKGRRPDDWIGIWVDDVEAMYARVTAAGVTAGHPEPKFYGVRVLQVRDPEGYVWGFMERGPFVAQTPESLKE
uniref:VOC domain-containing protein n=1 Tax=Bellilinea caldifistulae TaxID=360411 RepID=A0A7C4L2Q5_9CHLR